MEEAAARQNDGAIPRLSLACVIERITSRWRGGPSITAVESFEDLPGAVRKAAKEMGLAPERVDSVLWASSIYLVRRSLQSEAQVEVAIFHEAYGHYGLEQLFGEELTERLGDIYRRLGGDAGIKEVARQYGVDLRVYEERVARQLDSETVSAGERNAVLLNGVRAKIVERGEPSWRERAKAIFGGLRAWFNERGFLSLRKLSEPDLAHLLAQARRGVRHGAERGGVAPALFHLNENPEISYSLLERVVSEKLPGKGDGATYAQMIAAWARDGLVRAEEIEWTGVIEWLSEQAAEGVRLSKTDVLDFLYENRIELREVVLRDSGVVRAREQAIRGLAQTLQREHELPSVSAYTMAVEIAGGNRGVSNPSAELEESVAKARGAEAAVLAAGRTEVRFGEHRFSDGEGYRELLLCWRDPLSRQEQAVQEQYAEFVEEILDRYGEANPSDALERGLLSQSEDERFREIVANELAVRARRYRTTAFRSSHYRDIPNVLAHCRFQERQDMEGRRLLEIVEVQSDWHQAGRRYGYLKDGVPSELRWEPKVEGLVTEAGAVIAVGKSPQEAARAVPGHERRVPDAPFRTKWPMLMVKRVIAEAVRQGFDAVVWNSGDHQVKRFDLSRGLSSLVGHRNRGRIDVVAFSRDGEEIIARKGLTSHRLELEFGKTIADRLMSETASGNPVVLSGGELDMGVHGLRVFYDQVLPKEVGRYVKRWGASVTSFSVPVAGGQGVQEATMHGFMVTPPMRADLRTYGQPLFRVRGDRGVFSAGGTLADLTVETGSPSPEAPHRAAVGP